MIRRRHRQLFGGAAVGDDPYDLSQEGQFEDPFKAPSIPKPSIPSYTPKPSAPSKPQVSQNPLRPSRPTNVRPDNYVTPYESQKPKSTSLVGSVVSDPIEEITKDPVRAVKTNKALMDNPELAQDIKARAEPVVKVAQITSELATDILAPELAPVVAGLHSGIERDSAKDTALNIAEAVPAVFVGGEETALINAGKNVRRAARVATAAEIANHTAQNIKAGDSAKSVILDTGLDLGAHTPGAGKLAKTIRTGSEVGQVVRVFTKPQKQVVKEHIEELDLSEHQEEPPVVEAPPPLTKAEKIKRVVLAKPDHNFTESQLHQIHKIAESDETFVLPTQVQEKIDKLLDSSETRKTEKTLHIPNLSIQEQLRQQAITKSVEYFKTLDAAKAYHLLNQHNSQDVVKLIRSGSFKPSAEMTSTLNNLGVLSSSDCNIIKNKKKRQECKKKKNKRIGVIT